MFGFGRKKRREYADRVDEILNRQLGINTSARNKNFPGGLYYLYEVDYGFDNNYSAELRAVSFAMYYWAGLLEKGTDDCRKEAKKLRALIIEFTDACAVVGKVPSENQTILHTKIKEYSDEYDL